MDKSAMTQAMKVSISEVLEQMFFMPIDFMKPEQVGADPQHDNGSIFAKLGFNGIPNGTFILQMSVTQAQSVSADFLGTHLENLSDDQVTGTVLEMVNMLAGSTLSHYDRQALYDLHLPERITCSDARDFVGKGSDLIVIRIQTLENRMMFQLIVQEA